MASFRRHSLMFSASEPYILVLYDNMDTIIFLMKSFVINKRDLYKRTRV